MLDFSTGGTGLLAHLQLRGFPKFPCCEMLCKLIKRDKLIKRERYMFFDPRRLRCLPSEDFQRLLRRYVSQYLYSHMDWLGWPPEQLDFDAELEHLLGSVDVYSWMVCAFQVHHLFSYVLLLLDAFDMAREDCCLICSWVFLIRRRKRKKKRRELQPRGFFSPLEGLFTDSSPFGWMMAQLLSMVKEREYHVCEFASAKYLASHTTDGATSGSYL